MSLPIICAITGRPVGFSVIDARMCRIEPRVGQDAEVFREIKVRVPVAADQPHERQIRHVLHRREREDRVRLREEVLEFEPRVHCYLVLGRELPGAIIAGAMKHSNDDNSKIDDLIENQVVANRIEPELRSQIFAAGARCRMCRENFTNLSDSIEQNIRRHRILVCDVIPDFDEVEFRARGALDRRHQVPRSLSKRRWA